MSLIRAKVFAPVNIAWVKYMGKSESGAATNASLSATLSNLGTYTEISAKDENDSGFAVHWSSRSDFLSEKGKDRVEKFLLKIKNEAREFLVQQGFPDANTEFAIDIDAYNNIPHSAGIASSASGFAAVTTAALAVFSGSPETFRKRFETDPNFRSECARFSSLGSGSSGRSFFGPWTQWCPPASSAAFSKLSDRDHDLVDMILVFSNESKKVSSSEAHQLVSTSPLFQGRTERADQRLNKISSAILEDQIETVRSTVLEEALDMHELFHTSTPAFSYLNDHSKKWIEILKNENGFLTIDAGPNLHWFVKKDQADLWRARFQADPSIQQVLVDPLGTGLKWG